MSIMMTESASATSLLTDDVHWESAVNAVDGRVESCDLGFTVLMVEASRLYMIYGYIGVVASEADPISLFKLVVVAPNDDGILSTIRFQSAWLASPNVDTRLFEQETSEDLTMYEASSHGGDAFSLGIDMADGGMLAFHEVDATDELVVRIPPADESQPFHDYAACVDDLTLE